MKNKDIETTTRKHYLRFEKFRGMLRRGRKEAEPITSLKGWRTARAARRFQTVK